MFVEIVANPVPYDWNIFYLIHSYSVFWIPNKLENKFHTRDSK